MKKSFSFIVAAFIGFALQAQTLRTVNNTAFKRGESLRYKVYYDAILTGKVNAGEAELDVKNEDKLIDNRSTYHVVGLGLSKGAFNLFFKVVDRYESYIDEQSLIPWLSIRRVNEGGYKISQDVTFNQFKNIASALDNNSKETRNIKVTENMQDIISALYYARTLDISDAKIGQEFPIKFFLDDTTYTSKIIYEGKEYVTVGLGKFRCLKFKPMVAMGNIFKDPYPMTLWITDDKNHIPLLAESAIIVGKVKLELINYSGLANELTSKIE